MKSYFSFFNKKIFLWGNTPITQKIYCTLLDDDYEVAGVIEKNGTSFENLRVFSFEEISEKYTPDDVVIILCMKSALNQESLAEIAYSRGFRQIVFSPLTLQNEVISHHLRSNYQQLMYGEAKELVFPSYELTNSSISGYKIIRYYKHSVELDVDIRYVRTFYRSNVSNKLLPYRDKPIAEYDVLNELYEYFYCNKAYPNKYLNLYMGGTKDAVFLNDRKELFDSFRKGYKTMGEAFFESMPIPVECNENGLNIKDGHHRASFLFMEGIEMVPVVLSKKDFEFFLNNIVGR